MTRPDALRRLAEEQQAFLAALVDGAPCPPGFDADAIAVARSSLAHKRSRTAATVWPRLSRCLGARWQASFDAHVSPHPLLRKHGPLDDGWRLAEAGEARGWLDDGAADELASVRLRFRRVADGVERRRSPVRLVRARGRLVVSVFGRVFQLGR